MPILVGLFNFLAIFDYTHDKGLMYEYTLFYTVSLSSNGSARIVTTFSFFASMLNPGYAWTQCILCYKYHLLPFSVKVTVDADFFMSTKTSVNQNGHSVVLGPGK